MPSRIERPRPAVPLRFAAGPRDYFGQVPRPVLHLTEIVPRYTAAGKWYRRNGCATSAGHRTGRQPATRSARRASHSLHLAALAAPHPPCSSPWPSPTLRAFLAPASCSQGPKRPPGPACGLPAGCLPRRGCLLPEPLLRCRRCLSAWALLQRPHPCSGPVQSGGSRGCSGVQEVLCWRWVGAETCLVVKV